MLGDCADSSSSIFMGMSIDHMLEGLRITAEVFEFLVCCLLCRIRVLVHCHARKLQRSMRKKVNLRKPGYGLTNVHTSLERIVTGQELREIGTSRCVNFYIVKIAHKFASRFNRKLRAGHCFNASQEQRPSIHALCAKYGFSRPSCK